MFDTIGIAVITCIELFTRMKLIFKYFKHNVRTYRCLEFYLV